MKTSWRIFGKLNDDGPVYTHTCIATTFLSDIVIVNSWMKSGSTGYGGWTILFELPKKSLPGMSVRTISMIRDSGIDSGFGEEMAYARISRICWEWPTVWPQDHVESNKLYDLGARPGVLGYSIVVRLDRHWLSCYWYWYIWFLNLLEQY